jgi:hypothetical protein
MTKAPKKEKRKPMPQMPFDEAMERILRAPPQHIVKVKSKKAKKKTGF